MPGSDAFGKEWAADIYAVTKPTHVIDIGPGLGTWSMMFRPRHRAWWTAVEIWEPYVELYDLNSKYDEVHIGDCREYVFPFETDDNTLFIAGDVLEHIPQNDAERIMKAIVATGAHFLYSVPINHYEQGEWGGNPHEAHLWYPTHEWALDILRPDAWVLGNVVGAYWVAPR